MTTDAIQLLRDHWSEVPQADEDTVEHALAYAIRSTTGRRALIPTARFARPRLAALAVAGAAVLAGAVVGVNALLPASQPPSGSIPSSPGGVRVPQTDFGVDPFGESGETITLDQLHAAASHPIAIPNSPLANARNVGNVWLNTGSGAAAAYWPSSGIEIFWGGTGVDYSGIPAEDIQTINGVKVILRPPMGDYPTSSLLFPEPDGHLVELATNGSIDDLVGVAQTLPIYSNP
jgi:hypothetical protein